MKACVLASGSKGNVSYVASSTTQILVDLGTTSSYAEKRLLEIGVDPKDISAIVISHTHSDHINGLKVFIKKYNPTLFVSEKMYQDLKIMFPISNYEIIDGNFSIGDITVNVIKTSHDASDSNGYIFENNGKSVVYVTDTGYINVKNHKKLKDKSIGEINSFADKILPEVYTNLEPNEVISLAPNMLSYKMSESIGWPYKTRGITTDRWYGVPVTLEENVKQLHREIFGEEDYTVSEIVKGINDAIISKTGYSK